MDMMYLFVDRNRVKLLYLKKTLLAQYESAFYDKTHQVDLLTKDGKIANTDYLASAIKEAVTSISGTQINEKEVCLILPHSAFHFLRTEVPKDLAPTAISSFLADKVRAAFPTDTESLLSDYLFIQNEKEKQIIFYGFQVETYKTYADVFNLINLQIRSILPETMTYFKLFEKTLRKEKKEHILYITSEKNYIGGYLYDSYGPLEQSKSIDEQLKPTASIEKILKQKAEEYEKQGKKINRIILSGEHSDQIRQDTFTKHVGVWTNPLKRIIPDFYQDYLKILITDPNKSMPFLQYDVCLGAFIFSIENKYFSLFKKGGRKFKMPTFTPPQIKLPIRAAAFFLISFIISFGIWMFVNNSTSTPSFLAQATPTPTKAIPTLVPDTPTPTPSPTPAIDRNEIRIKVLNGSGIRGKASDVKNVLIENGYQEILTGNADNFDYEQTEIQIGESASQSAQLVISDLKNSVSDPLVSDLTEDSSADIIIIVGTDFK